MPMLCTRSITFTIPGAPGGPGVQVSVVENAGDLVFTADVLDTPGLTADLRGLFFHFDETLLAGLQIADASPLLTKSVIGLNDVRDLGNGANMLGAVRSGFDVGLEFGTEGIGRDDVSGPVSFTLDGATALTLDSITHMLFGARLGSIGAPGAVRNQSSKTTFVAPAAPDARDDTYRIYEDGASGLTSPSTTPSPVAFHVLANDTDADGDLLSITRVGGATHGTLEIASAGPGGDYVLYTPDEDYAGTDSFSYCITDNNGGTDFATVSVGIEAVADIPDLQYTVLPGSWVNEVIVRVTATQSDADSSEFVDRIELSGIPAGIGVAPGSLDPGSEPDQLVQDFVLTLPLNADTSFDLGIAAVSTEVSNADQEVATLSLPIVLEYNSNPFSPTFVAIDQSIWDSGDEYTWPPDERFIGFDDGFEGSGGLLIGYDVGAHLKAGFQSTLKFEAGEIDADLTYDLVVDTNYNKTTDTLLISSTELLTGGDFRTVGPEGSYKLDFIFNYDFHLALTYDIGIDSGTIVRVSDSDSTTEPILNISSDGLASTIPFPPPFDSLSVTLEWPKVPTDAGPGPSPGSFSSSGGSNNFLQLNFDIDQALADIFLGGVNPFDIAFDIDLVWGNLQLADLDLFGGVKLLQAFLMQEQGFAGVLEFEDGSSRAFTFGTDILLQNASLIDAGGDGDGNVEFAVTLDPQATLKNDTDVEFNVGFSFDVLKASGGYDVGLYSDSFDFGPVYHAEGTQPVVAVGIYDNTFGLDFGPQDFLFSA